jgi:hypothetical protein
LFPPFLPKPASLPVLVVPELLRSSVAVFLVFYLPTLALSSSVKDTLIEAGADRGANHCIALHTYGTEKNTGVVFL